MLPRFFVPTDAPLTTQQELDLPEQVSRHVQVLRLQPGEQVSVFDGFGGQWTAEVLAMGRKVVRIAVREHEDMNRELPRSVTLALTLPFSLACVMLYIAQLQLATPVNRKFQAFR